MRYESRGWETEANVCVCVCVEGSGKREESKFRYAELDVMECTQNCET